MAGDGPGSRAGAATFSRDIAATSRDSLWRLTKSGVASPHSVSAPPVLGRAADPRAGTPVERGVAHSVSQLPPALEVLKGQGSLRPPRAVPEHRRDVPRARVFDEDAELPAAAAEVHLEVGEERPRELVRAAARIDRI